MEPLSDSPEDWYQYLMTPRREQRTTQAGAFTHFGPERYATMNPGNAAAAEIVMGQMADEEQRQVARDRIGAAETVMTGRSPDAGGSMSMGGTSVDIHPKGPMSGSERVTSMAGGFPADPIQEAEIKAGARRELTNADVTSRLGKASVAQARLSKRVEGIEAERHKYQELDEFANVPIATLYENYKAGKFDPPGILKYHFTEMENLEKEIQMWHSLAADARSFGEGGEGGVSGYWDPVKGYVPAGGGPPSP
jgi:hypothetical protein